MIKLEVFTLFVFIFSCLSIFNMIYKFIINLLKPSPDKLKLSRQELFFYGLTLSYILTYIIKN
jgi:hypothetical protein